MLRVILARKWHQVPATPNWFRVFKPETDDGAKAAQAVIARYTREGKGLHIALLIHQNTSLERAAEIRNNFRRQLARQIIAQARRGVSQRIWGVETHIPGWALLVRAQFPSERAKMEEEFKRWCRGLIDRAENRLQALEEEALLLEGMPTNREENPHFEEAPEEACIKRANRRLEEEESRVQQIRNALQRSQLFCEVEAWLEPLLALGLEAPLWFDMNWLYRGGKGKKGIHPAFLFIAASLRNRGRQAMVAERLGLAPDHSLVRKTLAAMKMVDEGKSEARVLEQLALDPAIYNLATGNTVGWEVAEPDYEVFEPKEFDPVRDYQTAAISDTLLHWGLEAEEVEQLPEERKKLFKEEVLVNFAAYLPAEERHNLLSALQTGGVEAAQKLLRLLSAN